MILYHGSNINIETIDLNKSLHGKDFGKGFYLSDDEAQAMNMAKLKTSLFGGEAIINRYEFDESILSSEVLNVELFTEYSLEWAEFILMNRKNHTDIPSHSFDIVYGPIANDKVGVQIRN